MEGSAYWNPKTETLDRGRLEALQLGKLRRVVDWAASRSPHYRRTLAGLAAGDLRSLDDLRPAPRSRSTRPSAGPPSPRPSGPPRRPSNASRVCSATCTWSPSSSSSNSSPDRSG